MADQHGGNWDPNSVAGSSQHYSPNAAHHGGDFTPPLPTQPTSYTNVPNTGYANSRSTSYTTVAQPYQPANTVYQIPTPPAPMSYTPSPPVNQGYAATERIEPAPTQQHYGYQGGQGSYGQAQDPRQDSAMGRKPTVMDQTTPYPDKNDAFSSNKYDKEFPIRLKDWRHVIVSNTLYRVKRPNHYQAPGYTYLSPQEYRHRDFAGRVTKGPYFDRYLHHDDGRLRKLIVAATDDIFQGPGTSTWRRTYVRNVSPLVVRLATWVMDFSYDPDTFRWDDWGIMLLRAFPAALAMQCVFWQGGTERWQFNGSFAPVPYRFWGDAKVWSNHLENKVGTSLLARNNSIYRLLKPRYLCFLRKPYDDTLQGVDVRSVEQWEQTDGQDTNLSYLFIAYSTEHFNHGSDEDKIALHHIAETAARAAKVSAYWVAVSCMRDKDELEADVYRISDVLRGAQGMIIAVGLSKTKASNRRLSTDQLLAQWGTRMWTFPEVLLSPGQQIPVYTRGGDLRAPLVVSKNQFAARAWAHADAEESRQLVDHYIGSLDLSRLELAVTALKCLYTRQTTEHLPGDQAYALMGLLRLRPQIDKTDTPFQAFSRLSLANDSDKLLERYLCTLPTSQHQPWYDMSDAYNSALWDIEPYCQVAAICDRDTIVLDGARGASIRWKSFFSVGFKTGFSWKRWFAVVCMENMSLLLILMIVFFAVRIPAGGVVCLLLWLYVFLNAPRLIRTVYGGKFTEVQAALFGFEGYLNAPTVERAIFGGNFGRMGWSTNGSPLSVSNVNEDGERVGVDPSKDPEVRIKIEKAKTAKPGEMRVFTLVDTYNMQLTLFEAVRPPICLFLCASEGGMQRAVGCSYDWTTQTMYRETVLRMPTETLNRMDRATRVRIGIQRPEIPSYPAGSEGAQAV